MSIPIKFVEVDIMGYYHLYIVLTRTNSVLSNLIHLFKSDDYTHASISFDRELSQMYSFGRKYTYNPFIGRFKKEDINEGLYSLCNTLPGIIIELDVTKEQYERAKEIVNQFISNSHQYKYNYRGLIHSLINKPAYSEKCFLCSEFVYYVLKESQIVDLHTARNLVRPQNFLNLEGRLFYKGDLKELSTNLSPAM